MTIFTQKALRQIAETTLGNISEFEESGTCKNAVTTAQFVKTQK